jgi:hypothetical protein
MTERSNASPSQVPGRLSNRRPIAIVDIGSNSVRLVAYECASRALTPIYNEKTMCGLARGVASSGMLDAEAVDLALQTLRRFRDLCGIMGAGKPSVLATAAARDARNGPAFLKAAGEACDATVELLSGSREAHLSALGVVSGVHRPDGVVGGSGRRQPRACRGQWDGRERRRDVRARGPRAPRSIEGDRARKRGELCGGNWTARRSWRGCSTAPSMRSEGRGAPWRGSI